MTSRGFGYPMGTVKYHMNDVIEKHQNKPKDPEVYKSYAVQANVCNRCLRFIPIETKMAQVKELLSPGQTAHDSR